jgi:TPR repeat protein
MPQIEKTVFISYRRTDGGWALLISNELVRRGYDVFLDYERIASGDFGRVILQAIEARAHFLVLLTPTALDRCHEPGDWLRREIESAVSLKRNIVPVHLPGFNFSDPKIRQQLTGAPAVLEGYSGMTVSPEYLDSAMDRLCNKFLNVSLEMVLHPAMPLAPKPEQPAPGVQQRPPTAREMYCRGRTAEDAKDDIEAVNCYRKSASADNLDAMASLGVMYRDGRGDLLKDYVEAVSWFRKAADAGNTTAMVYLGLMYVRGAGGLSKDDRKAMSWFRKAADAGDAKAMNRLGFLYEYSPEDWIDRYRHAMNWYRKASVAGSPEGMANLGRMYEYGRGGATKDLSQALACYRKAASAGGGDGMRHLGVMCLHGTGLPHDPEQAVGWFRQAVGVGDHFAMFFLGEMYERGLGGLPQDVEQAVFWYRKAAAAGNHIAEQTLWRFDK